MKIVKQFNGIGTTFGLSLGINNMRNAQCSYGKSVSNTLVMCHSPIECKAGKEKKTIKKLKASCLLLLMMYNHVKESE